MAKQKVLIAAASFIGGVYRYPGEVIETDAELTGREDNLAPITGEIPVMPAVQIAPIGPTGPNPTSPQQIPPDARQTVSGYVIPGEARLVGEVTASQEVRLADLMEEGDTAQGDLRQTVVTLQDELAALRAEISSVQARGGDAAEEVQGDVTASVQSSAQQSAPAEQNDDDALVDGTVAEVTADLGSKTDEELQALRAAEVDREKPRQGVLKAVDAELKSRQG